jgi:hypothetical protein
MSFVAFKRVPLLVHETSGEESKYAICDLLDAYACAASHRSTWDAFRRRLDFYLPSLPTDDPHARWRRGSRNIVVRLLHQRARETSGGDDSGSDVSSVDPCDVDRDDGDALIERACEFIVAFHCDVFADMAKDRVHINLHAFLYKIARVPQERGMPFVLVQWFRDAGYIVPHADCTSTQLGETRHPRWVRRFTIGGVRRRIVGVDDAVDLLAPLHQRLRHHGLMPTTTSASASNDADAPDWVEWKKTLEVQNFSRTRVVQLVFTTPGGNTETHCIQPRRRETLFIRTAFAAMLAWTARVLPVSSTATATAPTEPDVTLGVSCVMHFVNHAQPHAHGMRHAFEEWRNEQFSLGDPKLNADDERYDRAHGGGETVTRSRAS